MSAPTPSPSHASPLPFIDAAALARVPMPAAIAALERALVEGLDPEADPPRVAVPVPHGQLLLMPAATPAATGVKVISVAPDNGALGLPRIQGLYMLFDAVTLAPRALFDGAALTTLRTPAVSALAIARLAAPDAARLVVFGAGPQALGHVLAARAVRPITAVEVLARDTLRREALLARAAALGLDARAGDDGSIARADVICCCTSARTPLFAGDAVRAGAAVIAIGSHEPDAREVDEALVARAAVVVEARGAALREAGDVIMAIARGALDASRLVPLRALVRGEVPAAALAGRPALFKSVGMAWQDAVVAAAALTSLAAATEADALAR